MIKFYYKKSENEIEVWQGSIKFTTISTGGKVLDDDTALKLCQDWMDEKGDRLANTEYKVYIELH